MFLFVICYISAWLLKHVLPMTEIYSSTLQKETAGFVSRAADFEAICIFALFCTMNYRLPVHTVFSDG